MISALLILPEYIPHIEYVIDREISALQEPLKKQETEGAHTLDASLSQLNFPLLDLPLLNLVYIFFLFLFGGQRRLNIRAYFDYP